MSRRDDLAPLFTDITLSADDAAAIVAALYDVAESDGTHAEELEMIRGFVAALDLDLGDDAPKELPPMSPAKLALAITDPAVRTIAVQCALLLAWADGEFSKKERERVEAYATALGIGGDEYRSIARTIGDWVESGDAGPLFAD